MDDLLIGSANQLSTQAHMNGGRCPSHGRGYGRVRSWGRARNAMGKAWSRPRGQAQAKGIDVGLMVSSLLDDGVDQGIAESATAGSRSQV
jgi:hypothetical protein